MELAVRIRAIVTIAGVLSVPLSVPGLAQDRTAPAAAGDPARRCDQLTGLERSECERRNLTDEDAPAEMTRSMREKEEKARAEQEAASTTNAADPCSDTLGSRPRSATPSTPPKEEDASEVEKRDTDSDSETDTLERRK